MIVIVDFAWSRLWILVLVSLLCIFTSNTAWTKHTKVQGPITKQQFQAQESAKEKVKADAKAKVEAKLKAQAKAKEDAKAEALEKANAKAGPKTLEEQNKEDLKNQIKEAEKPQATPTPTPPPPQEQENDMSIWGTFGMGMPAGDNKFKDMSTGYTLGLSFASHSDFDYGIFGSVVGANFDDVITYPATGYVESRSYKVSIYMFGGRLSYQIFEDQHIFADFGIAWGTSTLSTVSTTAPIPSTLQVGYAKNINYNIGYVVGYQYEYPFANFGVGIEAGYRSTSTIPELAITEVYGALLVKYYFSRPKAAPSGPVGSGG